MYRLNVNADVESCKNKRKKNEWHNLEENPNDLHEHEGEYVLVRFSDESLYRYGTGFYDNGFMIMGFNKQKIIAWKEVE